MKAINEHKGYFIVLTVRDFKEDSDVYYTYASALSAYQREVEDAEEGTKVYLCSIWWDYEIFPDEEADK